jgi:hypothetical protein
VIGKCLGSFLGKFISTHQSESFSESVCVCVGVSSSRKELHLDKETAKLMKERVKRCGGGCKAVAVVMLMHPEKSSSGIFDITKKFTVFFS